ncbi:MAG: outer membrane protein assembly factor BamA, partial [Casimicrobiaceae bacterium]
FANVSAVPEVDKEKHTVAYTIYIDPGRRVYVRKINIVGNARTRDDVIRREARQLEGAWFDSQRIDRSKVRIKRLGYFDDVNVETQPVPGSADQADIEFSVVERSTGNLLAGVGYSSSDGVVFSASVAQQNVLGTGNSIALAFNTSKVDRTISTVYTDPYWTVDGISRTIELYQKNIDPTSLAVSNYASSTLGAAMSFGIPISETDTINLGGRLEHTKLTLFPESPPVYIDYVNNFGAVTNSYILTAGWSRDTRDDITYPSSGRLQSFNVEVGLPLSNVAYYKVEYLDQWFWPVFDPAILMLRGNIGYADGYSGDPLPFFKAFYAGGVGSVRGYEQSSLGPRDIYGNSLGGNRKIIGNAELFYPLVKGAKAVRATVFADMGQIYANGDQPDFESFRFSTGAGIAWNSPIGPLKFSYAIPLNAKNGDRLQRFQFQIGTVF